VDGADVARDFLLSNGVSADAVRRVWSSIAAVRHAVAGSQSVYDEAFRGFILRPAPFPTAGAVDGGLIEDGGDVGVGGG
jgi:hypothetical protein